MHAMVLNKLGAPLEWTELADRQPGRGEIRVKVSACGVCRTDLHVVNGARATSLPVSPSGNAKRASAIVAVAKPPSDSDALQP
jgi:NADPH:quinone reductase-like Zn-dependent oxidoreductase